MVPVAALGLTACAQAGADDPQDQEDRSEVGQLSAELAGRAVFTMSNAAAGNSVIAFARSVDGSLAPAGETPTGGLGSGGGLGSQGAVTLTEDGRFLLVVNAGSNDVSAFAVTGTSLQLRSRRSSGGVQPISVAVRDHLVYALNAGGTANVSGLYLDSYGQLYPISGSAQPLSAAAPGPAQVSFSPSGASLVVTEKGTNTIDTFAVRYDGRLASAVSTPSAGQTPFGFAFTSRGILVVSEAAGGAAGAGTVSSYRLQRTYGVDRRARVASGPIADLQSAPCWIVITNHDRFAYTSNTASGTISGYRVRDDGALTLFDDQGVTAATGAGSRPIDMAFDRSSRHLYVLNAGTHTVAEFDRAPDGSLLETGVAMQVPASAVGLAAR
jgi:6-phosphogluconolactonase